MPSIRVFGLLVSVLGYIGMVHGSDHKILTVKAAVNTPLKKFGNLHDILKAKQRVAEQSTVTACTQAQALANQTPAQREMMQKLIVYLRTEHPGLGMYEEAQQYKIINAYLTKALNDKSF